MTACGMLLCDQRRDMRVILDLGAFVIASDMTGEEVGAIEDAHFLEIGNQRQHAAHMGMRDGLCRPPDYADHRPECGFPGGNRCDGRGIIRCPPNDQHADSPVTRRKGRHSCRRNGS